jgi:hypothetical protein
VSTVKALAWVAGIVLLVLAAVAVYVLTNSAVLIERGIERYGSTYLGVAVDVGEVEVLLAEGSAIVHGVVVGNPPGFSGPPALNVPRMYIDLDMSRTSSALIVLESVAIEGAAVTALLQGRQSNLQWILDHLDSRIAAHERARQIRVVSEVQLVIEQLAFTGATANVVTGLGQARVDLPPIHLTDIGGDGGASVGQVLEQVLEPIVRAVLERAAAGAVAAARERLERRARSHLEAPAEIEDTQRPEE